MRLLFGLLVHAGAKSAVPLTAAAVLLACSRLLPSLLLPASLLLMLLVHAGLAPLLAAVDRLCTFELVCVELLLSCCPSPLLSLITGRRHFSPQSC